MFGAFLESATKPNSMTKQEAAKILNEIMKKCVLPRYIALEPSSSEANAPSQSFDLKIKGPFGEKDWNCLKGIVQKHNLSMKEIGGNIVIYKQ